MYTMNDITKEITIGTPIIEKYHISICPGVIGTKLESRSFGIVMFPIPLLLGGGP